MRHICIVNITASLLVADVWFIVAAAIHDHHFPLNETACVAATFFIHFFYLSVFFWMLTWASCSSTAWFSSCTTRASPFRR